MFSTARVDHITSNLAGAVMGEAKAKANAEIKHNEEDKTAEPRNLSRRAKDNVKAGGAMERLMKVRNRGIRRVAYHVADQRQIFSNMYNKETNPNGMLVFYFFENPMMKFRFFFLFMIFSSSYGDHYYCVRFNVYAAFHWVWQKTV